MQYDKLFRSQSVWKSIFSMAVPAVVIILVMIVYNMTDMFFIGRLGNTAMVAAISVASPVFSLSASVATMLGSGGSTLVARELGNGDAQKARVYASLCFWGAIVFGILIGAVLLIGADGILPLLGATEETWDYVKSYMCICAIGEPFMLASMTMGNIIRAEGGIKESMIGNLGANVVNMVLDPIFILLFGWGVAGAALATTIANLCGTLFYIRCMFRKDSVMNMHLSLALQNPSLLLSILALGLPSAASTLLNGLASTFSNRILASYGTNAIAAMAAAGKTTMVIGMLQIGICSGVQPLLAYNYGAKDGPRLREILKKLVILTVAVGTVSGVLCMVFRSAIIGLFLTEAEAAAIGEAMVPILVVASPFIGLLYLATNFIQASGHAAPATVLSVLRQGLLLIPLLYICSVLFGLTGIPIAHMLADLLSVGVGLILLFRQARQIRTWETASI